MNTFTIQRLTEATVSLPDYVAYLFKGGCGLPPRPWPVVMPRHQIGEAVEILKPEAGEPQMPYDSTLAVIVDILPHDPAEHGPRRAYRIRWSCPWGRVIQEGVVREDRISHTMLPAPAPKP